MGPLTFGKREEQIFLGREISKTQDYSEDTAVAIDQEVKKFVMDNYERARAVLTEHKAVLLKIADELLAREVLDADQVNAARPGPAARRARAGRHAARARRAPRRDRREPRRRSCRRWQAGRAGIAPIKLEVRVRAECTRASRLQASNFSLS